MIAKAHAPDVARARATPATKRVAAYCRQSVADSESPFSSLDAQRQAIEAFVASRKSDGWVASAARYDDGGYSGATIERPAFRRLMADVRAGTVDVVAVYKIDRLSRSLLDFTSLLKEFESRGVAFVSVTQQFDSSTALGRMVLAQLAIFAEFERETICERTRDKMRAARRQGRWTGGHVPLGYDLRDSRLHKNEEEARRVVEIFELFLQRGTLAGTAAELVRRGWRPKQGAKRRVSEFSATRLARMLANPAYIGRVHAHGQLVEGQHEAIVDADLWDRVQAALRGKRRDGPPQVHRAPKSLLGELLRCARCGAAMTSSSTAARGKRHRYYVCKTAQLRGARACPGSRVPAQALEEFVVSRVAAMGRDPALAAEVAACAKAALVERRAKAQAERTACAQERARWERERERLAAVVALGGDGAAAARARQADVAAALEALTAREQGAQAACDALVGLRGDEGAVRGALGDFGPLWATLEPAEKASVLRELLDEIACDAVGGTVTLRPKSKTLAALLRQEVTP